MNNLTNATCQANTEELLPNNPENNKNLFYKRKGEADLNRSAMNKLRVVAIFKTDKASL